MDDYDLKVSTRKPTKVPTKVPTTLAPTVIQTHIPTHLPTVPPTVPPSPIYLQTAAPTIAQTPQTSQVQESSDIMSLFTIIIIPLLLIGVKIYITYKNRNRGSE